MSSEMISPIKRAARLIADAARAADPGALAALRRMGQGGAPLLWRLAAQDDVIAGNLAAWRDIARILAILTPKGRPEDRPRNPRSISLGAALADGGDPDWHPGPDPRPNISEDRLARFLATRGAARAPALERLARALARSLPPDAQIRPEQIAWAILRPIDPEHRIARDYYARLTPRPSQKDA